MMKGRLIPILIAFMALEFASLSLQHSLTSMIAFVFTTFLVAFLSYLDRESENDLEDIREAIKELRAQQQAVFMKAGLLG